MRIEQAPDSWTPPASRPLPRSKRFFDISLAAAVLLVLLPFLIVVTVVIRVVSRGPVLFRQTRLGRGRRPFVMYKFRTMYAGCPDDIHRDYVTRLLTEEVPPVGGSRGLYKIERDPRVTPIGRILRRTSIDELPQLLNVLNGDMSLVGPRPALPWEADLFPPSYKERFEVQPGLTGLWQVSGRNRLTMKQGLDLDLEYLRRQSLRFDILILLRTIPALLSPSAAE